MTIQPPQIDEILLKGYDPNVTRRLISFTRPYRWQLLVALILMLIASVASVAGPYLVKIVLDSGLGAKDITALRQSVILFLILTGLQWLVTYLRVNMMARVAQSVIFDLRARLFQHLQELSLSFYSRFSVGRVITRVINDVGVLRDFLTWTVLAVARDLFAFVGILVVMLAMDVHLSLMTFTVLPIMVLATIAFRKRARDNYRKVRAAISWVNSVLAENINGVRVVQAFSRQAVNYRFFTMRLTAITLIPTSTQLGLQLPIHQ